MVEPLLTGRTGTISPIVWVTGLGFSLGSAAALVTAGWRATGDRRAAFYGAATGIEFGTTAALMKAAVGHLSHPASVFARWATYAMIAAGVLGMFLMQHAKQAGKLVAAQPGITLLDPFTAIMSGIFGLSEQAQTGGMHLGLATGGGMLMVTGAMLLSRSPILEHSRRASGTSQRTSHHDHTRGASGHVGARRMRGVLSGGTDEVSAWAASAGCFQRAGEAGAQADLRRWRTMRRRSRSVAPPQTPSRSRLANACSRQAWRTGHTSHTALAGSASASSSGSG